MAAPSTLVRIYRAARWEIERRVERFVAPAEEARYSDRGDRRRDESFLSKSYSEVVSNPYALMLPRIDEPGRIRPPTGEIEDLPIQAWIDWSLRSVRGGLVDQAMGNFGRPGMLTEAMIGDDRVQSAFDGRAKGVTRCLPNLVPARTGGAVGVEVVEALDEVWDEILPEETTEEILRWSVFTGFTLIEVIWEPWPIRDAWLPRLKVWHPYYIYFRNDVRKYVAITKEGPLEIDPGDAKWLLYCPHGFYRGWLLGRVRSCAVPWLVRQFALRDLARFSEVHGMPMRLAKYPAQAPAEDKARFVAGIKSLGAETTVGLPIQAGRDAAAWGVELVEAKDTSWEAFIALRDACNASITLAIRGTNLTSEVGQGNSGNRAAAEVHREEEDDYTLTDRRKLMRMFRRDLLSWFAIFNFGDSRLAPSKESQFVDPDSEDLETKLKVQEQSAKTVVQLRAAGAPVDALRVYEEADVPLIEGREEEANDQRKQLPPPTTVSAPGSTGSTPAATPEQLEENRKKTEEEKVSATETPPAGSAAT